MGVSTIDATPVKTFERKNAWFEANVECGWISDLMSSICFEDTGCLKLPDRYRGSLI